MADVGWPPGCSGSCAVPQARGITWIEKRGGRRPRGCQADKVQARDTGSHTDDADRASQRKRWQNKCREAHKRPRCQGVHTTHGNTRDRYNKFALYSWCICTQPCRHGHTLPGSVRAPDTYHMCSAQCTVQKLIRNHAHGTLRARHASLVNWARFWLSKTGLVSKTHRFGVQHICFCKPKRVKQFFLINQHARFVNKATLFQPKIICCQSNRICVNQNGLLLTNRVFVNQAPERWEGGCGGRAW